MISFHFSQSWLNQQPCIYIYIYVYVSFTFLIVNYTFFICLRFVNKLQLAISSSILCCLNELRNWLILILLLYYGNFIIHFNSFRVFRKIQTKKTKQKVYWYVAFSCCWNRLRISGHNELDWIIFDILNSLQKLYFK